MKLESRIKSELHNAYEVRFRPGARPDEVVDTETSDLGVRTGRHP